MTEYNHEIVLIKAGATYTTDEIGNQIKGDDETVCLCGTASIGGSEFYRAGQSGIKPSVTATMNKAEYTGQHRVKLDGEAYTVIRTYETGLDEIELTLEPKAGA